MNFEEITNNEQVINLTGLDLLYHARHQFLSAAKDLIKQDNDGDIANGLHFSETAEAIQIAIDVETSPE